MARRVNVLGVEIDAVTAHRAVTVVCERLAASRRTFVITANPEFVMHARRETDVARIAAQADLVIPDGTGLVVASRLLRDPLPGRAPGRVVVDELVARLVAADASLFLLGAAPGVADRAARALLRRHERLRIAGTYAGSPRPEDDADTVARVAAARPDVLLVAYGMPAQERWIARNLPQLPSVRLAIGVGGVFDQLAGVARRPPRLVHAIGLEWLWRLALEPRRWRRQRVLPLFVALVLMQRIRPAAR